MPDVRFQQFRNELQRTAYPFSDDAQLTSVSGFVFPRRLLKDARIHPVGGAAGAFLRSVEMDSSLLLRIGIGDPTNGETCFGHFDAGSPTDVVALEDARGRAAGVLVGTIEGWQTLQASLVGEILFRSTDTPFVASVCIPMPGGGVTGVLLPDGTVLTGDVWLVGKSGIVLRLVDGKIRVDVVGDPYWKIRECEDTPGPVPAFCGIKTINRIPPNAKGDWKMTPGSGLASDNVIRIFPEDGGLRIEGTSAAGDGSGSSGSGSGSGPSGPTIWEDIG